MKSGWMLPSFCIETQHTMLTPCVLIWFDASPGHPKPGIYGNRNVDSLIGAFMQASSLSGFLDRLFNFRVKFLTKTGLQRAGAGKVLMPFAFGLRRACFMQEFLRFDSCELLLPLPDNFQTRFFAILSFLKSVSPPSPYSGCPALRRILCRPLCLV